MRHSRQKPIIFFLKIVFIRQFACLFLLNLLYLLLPINFGDSPSGKATDSDSVIREFKSLIPSQEKKIGFPIFFFLFGKVKERFELKALRKSALLRAFLAADRRLLQSTVSTFPFCFAKVKRKISHPQPRKKDRFSYLFFLSGKVKERFELKALRKSALLRAFLATDRRLLQSTLCVFPFCFAKVKRKYRKIFATCYFLILTFCEITVCQTTIYDKRTFQKIR